MLETHSAGPVPGSIALFFPIFCSFSSNNFCRCYRIVRICSPTGFAEGFRCNCISVFHSLGNFLSWYPNRRWGEVEGKFFLKNPRIFRFAILTSGNSGENKASPLEIPDNGATHLGNSKVKNQDPWKFQMIFSWSLLEIPLLFQSHPQSNFSLFLLYRKDALGTKLLLFYLTSGIFTWYFFNTLGNSIFLEEPIQEVGKQILLFQVFSIL